MLDLKDKSRCSSCVVSLPSVRLLNGVSLIPEEYRMIISLLAKCRIDFFLYQSIKRREHKCCLLHKKL